MSSDAPDACPVCGASLAGRRADARLCSAACRREHRRVSRLLSGEGDGRYGTLSQYDARPRGRAQNLSRAERHSPLGGPLSPQ